MINTGLRSAVCLLLLTLTAQAAPAHQQIFALVVANNHSLDRSLPALRYADDDGARFYELMASLGSTVKLLSVLDEETQKVFPALATRSRPPTRSALRAAMGQLRGAIQQARKAGRKTALYFYFAGHGDVGQDREGYIHLGDGRFSRSDLYREVISRSPADINHIIIDACNSYFLVNQRGGRKGRVSYQQAIQSFLAQETLDAHPNTGVVLSTASMAETHEWSRYRSGIFSHQLLSALWGGADVDGDRTVDYNELGAYVAAANLRVRDSRARLSIFARPPRSDLKAPVVNLKALRRAQPQSRRQGRVAALLEIPKQMQGHFYLEDDRGVRHVDFNKTAEQPIKLALLDRPYYLRVSSTFHTSTPDRGGVAHWWLADQRVNRGSNMAEAAQRRR